MTEEEKAEARNAIRFEYESLTGEPTINEQGEPDIDYVEYLENRVASRQDYARLQIEKDRERVIKNLELSMNYPTDAIQIVENLPINLD